MSDPYHRSLPKRVIFRKRWSTLLHLPLQAFAAQLSELVLGGRDFACLITDDAEIAELNQQYRNKPSATDVLSFESGESPEEDYAGDIAISIDHARTQAKALGHSVQDEVRVLMLHGALHLAGMDHETDSGAMRRKEDTLRKRFGLPKTLIARSL